MKRPLAVGGIFVVTAFLIGIIGIWLVPVGAIVLFIHFRRQNIENHKVETRYWLIILALLSLMYCLHWQWSYEQCKTKLLSEANKSGRGIIKEVRPNEFGTTVLLEPWFDEAGKKQPFALQILADYEVDIGSEVSFGGKVQEVIGGTNEGSFDVKGYYRENGILGKVKGTVTPIGPSSKYPIRKLTRQWREDHYRRLRSLLPELHGTVVGEMLLGIDAVDDRTRDLFQTAGVVHALAISGLHVTMIAGVIFSLFRLIGVGQRRTALLVTVLLWLYLIYTGGQISTMRAVIMISVYMGHFLFLKRYDQYTALALAAILLLLIKPMQLISVGFLLSFGAVASIFFITPKLQFIGAGSKHFLVQTMRVMLAVQIGITPVLLFFFYHLPTYSFIGNLLILPILTFVLGFSAMGILISYVHYGLAAWAASVAFWLVTYMLQTVSFLEKLPFSYVLTGRPHPLILIEYYGVLVLYLLGYKRVAAKTLLTGVIMSVLLAPYLQPDFQMDILDVGNGDCMVIRSENHVMMVDGGGQVMVEGDNVGVQVVKPFLDYNGIGHVDTVCISHSDFDHIYGIIELMDYVNFGRILLPRVYEEHPDGLIETLKEQADSHGVPIIYVGAGDNLGVGDLRLDVLYPMDEQLKKSNNSHSMVLLVQWNDLDLLLTGDIYVEDERLLLDHYGYGIRSIDVLKVAHHGSKTSSDDGFLEWTEPGLSIISVGRSNLYGHPAQEVRMRVASHSDHLLMTKDQGQITLVYTQGRLKAETYLHRERDNGSTEENDKKP